MIVGRTYTALWRAQRKLHAIQDIRLPVPVGISQAVTALLVMLVWFPIWFGLDLSRVMFVFGRFSPGAVLIGVVGPPILAGAAVGTHLTEGRTATEWAWSAIRWTMLPRDLHRMDQPTRIPDTVRLVCTAWLPDRGTR
jgi:hypothetical protein